MNPEENPFFEVEKPKPRRGMRLVDTLQGIVIVIFALIITYLFIATPNAVNGDSMFPNFKDDQILFTYRLPQVLGNTEIGKTLGLDYKRGDVIIFQKPGLDEFIKRVIAVPGDTVALRSGHVFVNDKMLVEKYLDPNLLTPEGNLLTESGGSITVEPGHLFVMGDNRPNSLDSRFSEVGQVKREWIIGRVILRLFPLDTISFIGRGEYQEI